VTNKATKGAAATTFNIKKAGANAIFQMDSGEAIMDSLDPSHLSNNRRSLINNFQDRNLSMLKIFPAYRLYFVEEDRETAYLADDLYGANCVMSLHVRREKDGPDVVTAQLTNVTDNLGTEAILPDSVASKLGVIKDDGGEGYFSRLKLQPGVTIQVRLGYGSKPDDLNVVFTGQIVEVTPGKVVTIVAQGHKRELLNEIQFVKESTTYFDIIQTILLKSQTPHLGKVFTVDQLSKRRLQSLVGPSADVSRLYSGFDRFTKKQSTSATQNIYLDCAREFGSGVPLIGSPGWVVPPQTGWEALKEVARHFPGHIVDVVPRGVDGTIFMGRPNQPYMAETPLPRETYLYEALTGRLLSKEKVDSLQDILLPFLSQSYSDNYGKYKDTLLEENRALYNRSSVPNKLSSPGGPLGTEITFERPEHFNAVRSYYGNKEVPTFDDYTNDWNFISDIDPEAMKFIAYWYFDVDPTKASTTALETSWQDLYFMFYNVKSGVFKDFSNALSTDQALAVPMSLLRPDKVVNDTTAIMSVRQAQERLLQQRVDSGIITDEEKRQAMDNFIQGFIEVNSPAKVQRGGFGDPAYTPVDSPTAQLNWILFSRGGAFKLFVHHLAEDLKARRNISQTANEPSSIQKARTNRSNGAVRTAGLAPGWKMFRNYHRIGSRDIVDNSLYASTAEMANCVLVRAPDSKTFLSNVRHGSGVETSLKKDDNGEETVSVNYEETQWVSWPTNDGLAFNEKVAVRNRKLFVAPELNAMDTDQKNRVLMSNMAAAIAPMYRGSIKVIGRDIKPHDVVYIDDPEKDLQGHFEVASVTHHFSAQTGWITDIEPHALVDINNPTARIELSAMQQFLDAIEPLMSLIDTGLLVINAVAILGSLGTAEVVVAPASVGVRTGIKAGVAKAVTWLSSKVMRGAASKGSTEASEAVAQSWFKRNVVSVVRNVGGHFARNQGRYNYSLFGAGAGYGLGRIFTNIQVKAQLGSTGLPISVHPLLYRGQPFQAGLDIEDQDVYTIDDRFESAWLSVRNGVSHFLYETWRNLPLVGPGNLHPADKFENSK
jgi:hypothetical protein